jgi:heme-degrading monooxygenase HmoA
VETARAVDAPARKEAAMYARIVTGQLRQDRVDEATDAWRERVAPQLERQAGFQGLRLYVDRATGKTVVIVHYASEADMAAGQQGFPERVAAIRDLLVGQPTVEQYEVAL